MPQVEKVFKVLDTIRKHHMATLPRIQFAGKTHDFVFLKDLASAYRRISGQDLDQDWFLKVCLTRENPFTVCHILKPQAARGYTVLFDRDQPKENFAVAKAITLGVLADLKENRPIRAQSVGGYRLVDEGMDEPVPQRESGRAKAAVRTPFDSSEDSGGDSGTGPAPKTVPATAATTRYEFSDSSDDLSCTFKSPFEKTPVQPKSDIRASIALAFNDYPALSMETFQTAYCLRNGAMFDYRTESCPIPRHPHGNLSKFLRCFDDLLELWQGRKLFLLCRTQHSKGLAARRFRAFFKKRDDPLFRVGCETLLTTILGCPTTLVLEDFVDLFKAVYGSPMTVLGGSSPAEFISALQSPNLVLVKKGSLYNLTVLPLRSSEFVESFGREAHRHVQEAEEALLQGTPKLSREGEAGCMFFTAEEPAVAELLCLAERNVPRLVQAKLSEDRPLPRDGRWIFLQASLRLGEGRAFFQ